MTKKMSLSSLKVKSFITGMEENSRVRGGLDHGETQWSDNPVICASAGANPSACSNWTCWGICVH